MESWLASIFVSEGRGSWVTSDVVRSFCLFVGWTHWLHWQESRSQRYENEAFNWGTKTASLCIPEMLRDIDGRRARLLKLKLKARRENIDKGIAYYYIMFIVISTFGDVGPGNGYKKSRLVWLLISLLFADLHSPRVLWLLKLATPSLVVHCSTSRTLQTSKILWVRKVQLFNWSLTNDVQSACGKRKFTRFLKDDANSAFKSHLVRSRPGMEGQGMQLIVNLSFTLTLNPPKRKLF